MSSKPQTFENHTRLVPPYHMVAFPILAVNFLWTLWVLIGQPGLGTLMSFLVSIALVLLFFYARLFALTAQDRIIRLEMQLRLARLLPPDLSARVDDLSVRQLIALRFAGDAELPDLVRQVLDGRLADGKAIKKSIRQWRADWLRV
jgi:hypothetical protein